MRFLIAAAVALAPFVASAEQSPFNYFDTYYRSSNVDISFDLLDNDADGTGFGLRYSHDFGGHAYAFAEYQDAQYDRVSDDSGFLTYSMDPGAKVMRGGVGAHSLGSGAIWYGALSFVMVEISYPQKNEDSGFGVKGGVRFPLGTRVAGFAEVGTVSAGDFGGAEYAAGVNFSLGQRAGLVLEYAVANLDNDRPHGDPTIELQFTDLRAGLRVMF